MFAAIFLPQFRLQAALRFRENSDALWKKPVAILDSAQQQQPQKALICELTDAAARAGVAVGMSAPQALARCAKLLLLPRAPEQERALSATLLDLACSLSLYVEQTAPEICTLDLNHALVADFNQWAQNAVIFAARFEMRAQVGIAANPDLALLAARAAQPAQPTLLVLDSTEFLSRLSLDALSPSPQIEQIVRDWGIRRVSDFARLPQPEIIERLGEEGGRLWRAAEGKSERLLNLTRSPEIFRESFDFEHEIETLEPLLFMLRRFLEQLALRLQLAYRVAGQLTLSLPLANGSRHERTFQIPAPTADVDTLFRIVDTHLETLRLDCGPVGICITIIPADPHKQQLGLFENGALRDPNRFGETLARLAALLGSERVGVAQLATTHRSDRFQLQPPALTSLLPTEVSCNLHAAVIGLPLRRYRPPIPAQVSLIRFRPASIISDQPRGKISDALGPYRLSGDWWDKYFWSTEEWIIEMENGGGIFQISDQPAGWFVDGCYEADGNGNRNNFR